MASTTKIMTLILALEYGNPDDVVTVSSYAAKMPEVRLGLHAGDRYVLQDLLYSMMLESHNDSACAVAEQVGGSVEAFAQMMNRKAAEIGLHDTYFITPNGLDAEDAGGVHHTTARDLAQLMRYCVTQSEQKEAFQAICQTRQYTFASCDGTRQFTVYNKNALLDRMDGVLAGKTGFTGNAGYCYVDEASVPAEVVAKEKEIMLAQMAGDPKNANKPDAVKQKMIEGKIKKFFKENCLVDQEFVKDGDLSVAQYTAKVAKDLGGDIKIVKFTRFQKGEGLEKRADDFAAEVASMVK